MSEDFKQHTVPAETEAYSITEALTLLMGDDKIAGDTRHNRSSGENGEFPEA